MGCLQQCPLHVYLFICQVKGSNVKNREDWLKNHEIPSSKLERYFLRPDLPEFNDMKICDYYGIYSFTKCNSTSNQMIDNGKPKNQIKKKRNRSYCSIQIIDPSKQEIFALRLLLFNFAGRSYDDLKTVDGRLYSSFYEAAFHRGLVGNSNEYFLCLNEAMETNRPPSDLRFMIDLFAQ